MRIKPTNHFRMTSVAPSSGRRDQQDNGPRTETMTVKMTTAELKTLTELAWDMRMNRSDLVRLFLNEGMARVERRRKGESDD